MQHRVALRVSFVAALLTSACATTRIDPIYKSDVDRILFADRSSKQIPAPVSLAGRPWKVGQFALYRRGTVPADGWERFSVLAVDDCGIWIEIFSYGYFDRHRWKLCLRQPDRVPADPLDLVQIAIWESNGGSPEIRDFRHGAPAKEKLLLRPVVAHLLPPCWDGAELVREDVDVPAGHFMQAIRSTEKQDAHEVTRWAHPDVPFDATVQARTSGGPTSTLLAYGDQGGISIVRQLSFEVAAARVPPPTPWSFYGATIGYAYFSGTSTEEASQATRFAMLYGQRVARHFDVVAEIGGMLGASYSPDPMQTQDMLEGLLDLRWLPFREPRSQPGLRGLDALYLQSGAGFAQLERDSSTGAHEAARGVVVDAAVGWQGIQGHDWAVGYELSDRLVFLNSGEGVRNDLAFTFFFHLYVSWTR